MKTVLAAIDFSPVADSVIQRGIELARASKARLVLLHVIQPPVFIASDGPAPDSSAITAAAERSADQRLARLETRLRREYKAVEAKRLTGIPVRLILGEADRLKVECIVIGSHGHGAVYDLLLGGTASGILKQATHPVVIMPPLERTPKPGTV